MLNETWPSITLEGITYITSGRSSGVEHDLAKVRVVSSNLIARSETCKRNYYQTYQSDKLNARVVELVDTPDLKSCALWGVRVQVPPRVLEPSLFEKALFYLKHLQRGFHPELVRLPQFHNWGFFLFY